jgi:hypothetical protein
MVKEPDVHTDHTAPLATMSQAEHGLGVAVEANRARRTTPSDFTKHMLKSFSAQLFLGCWIAVGVTQRSR